MGLNPSGLHQLAAPRKLSQGLRQAVSVVAGMYKNPLSTDQEMYGMPAAAACDPQSRRQAREPLLPARSALVQRCLG